MYYTLGLQLPMYRCLTLTLTNNIQKSQLTFHRVRVDLTHVPSLVRLSYLLDVYVPRPVVRVRHADPVIFRDHVVMDG